MDKALCAAAEAAYVIACQIQMTTSAWNYEMKALLRFPSTQMVLALLVVPGTQVHWMPRQDPPCPNFAGR
jgi:hypothetical protein